MRFSTALTVILSLATSSLSAPGTFNVLNLAHSLESELPRCLSKARANLMKVNKRAAAGVLTVQTYDEFNVSGGVAGNALAEVNAKFPVRIPFLPSPAPCFPLHHLTPHRSTSPISQVSLHLILPLLPKLPKSVKMLKSTPAASTMLLLLQAQVPPLERRFRMAR